MLHLHGFFNTVFQLSSVTEVHTEMCATGILADIPDKSQVTVGNLICILGLHDPVSCTEGNHPDPMLRILRLKGVDNLPDGGIDLFHRRLPSRTEGRQDLYMLNTVLRNLHAVAFHENIRYLLLTLCIDEHKVIAIVQLGISRIDKPGIIGDQTVLCLAEDLIEYRDRHNTAGDDFRKYITGTHTWKLIRVTDQNDLDVLWQLGEQLVCQPHIHHGELVNHDQLGIHLPLLFLFPSGFLLFTDQSQNTVNGSGILKPCAFRHTAAGTAGRRHKEDLISRMESSVNFQNGFQYRGFASTG